MARICLEINNALIEDWIDLGKVLKFDPVESMQSMLEDMLENRLRALREEIH